MSKDENFPDMESYKKAVGIPSSFPIKPSVASLYFLVTQHVTHIPYQNIHFHLNISHSVQEIFQDQKK